MQRNRVQVCALVLLIAGLLSPPCLPADSVLYALNRGLVYRVDAVPREVSLVGRLHRTAPSFDVSADGLIWGRGSLTSLVALDPHGGTIAATIAVPDRPYALMITSGGALFAAHNTLTARGFSISVADLRRRAVVSRIWGVQGLVTGFAQYRSYVYVAALGVRRPDYLYLYRIDVPTLHLEELYRVRKTEYRWELCVSGNRLYITYVRGTRGRAPPLVEVMDLESAQVVQRWSPSVVRVSRFTGGIILDNEGVYGPVVLPDGSHGIAELERQSGKVIRVLPVRGTLHRLIGVRGRCLIYTTAERPGGSTRISLAFHDMDSGRTIRSDLMQNQVREEASSENP